MQPYKTSPYVGVFAIVASAALVLAIVVMGCNNRPPADLGGVIVEPGNPEPANVDTIDDGESQPDPADADQTEPVALNEPDKANDAAEPTEIATNDDGEEEDAADPVDETEPVIDERDLEATIAEWNRPPVGPQIAKSITFDDLDLKKMEPDDVFSLDHMEESVLPLIGSKVRIKGVIHAGSTFTTKNIKQFVMVMNSECKFGPGGTAWHSIDVRIKEGRGVNFTTGPITVEGVLTMALFPGRGENGEPATWSVYRLEGIAK